MNDLAKNLIVWLILAAILMSVFNSFSPKPEDNSIDYSAFVSEVRNDRVSEVVIADLIIYGERNDGSKFKSIRPNIQDPKLMDDLVNHNVRVTGKVREEPAIMVWVMKMIVLIILFVSLPFGIWAAYLASHRDQSKTLWFFLTLIFPIAIVFIAFKDKVKDD